MRVLVTGTPGTGKTTATDALDTELDVVHLNDVIRDEELYTERDAERDSLVADVDALVEKYADREDVLVESHLAHYLPDADAVVVLRCRPDVLEERLRQRGTDEGADLTAVDREAEENSEAEALDVVLAEAVERHGEERVYEIGTTDRTPDEVAAEIAAVLAGERDPSAGDVDFTEYLL
ncbi:MAG: adenylate kinase family protein [Halarchaeum sp.]